MLFSRLLLLANSTSGAFIFIATYSNSVFSGIPMKEDKDDADAVRPNLKKMESRPIIKNMLKTKEKEQVLEKKHNMLF